ncbi:hypothetical protein CWC16_03970 [Pseudoalteromonas sp. S3776]|nr:hypothetical protein CWC16_03970 [Pseudoalteromonas sp. S3776]
MYLSGALMDYVAAFSQWGFLMAFLFCLVSSINKENKSPVYLSALMLCSYIFGSYIRLLDNLYLNWAFYDFMTIVALLSLQYFNFFKRNKAFLFLVLALTANGVLTLLLYYDLYVQYNFEAWWYWSVYSIGVNLIDVSMMLSLVVNQLKSNRLIEKL